MRSSPKPSCGHGLNPSSHSTAEGIDQLAMIHLGLDAPGRQRAGLLRLQGIGRLEGGQTTMITLRILMATAIMTPVGYVVWKGIDSVLGTSLAAQVISVGLGASIAVVLYSWLVLRMRIPEARQIQTLVMSRFRRGAQSRG